MLLLVLFNSCISQSSSNNDLREPIGQKAIDSNVIQFDTLPTLDTLKIMGTSVDSVGKDTIEKTKKWAFREINDSIRNALNKRPKHIYLSFDDGPLIGSRAIDSIISARNIKISAFLIGKHAHMSKHLMKSYKRYYDNPLVDCYNHSFTHANNRFQTFYSNPQKAFEDFEKNELDLELKHKIVRMPGRNIWYFNEMRRVDLNSGASTAEMLYNNGYKIYGWDVEWRINGITGKPVQTVDQVYTRIKNYMNNKSSLVPNNVVLLMHDDMFQHMSGQIQLSALLDSLQKHPDYHFEFLKDYPFVYN